MAVQRFDHVGVVVDDLEAVTAFFVDLGLERQGEGSVEGEWVDKIVGLEHVHTELVTVRTPDGRGSLELVKFHNPTSDEGADLSPANRLGLRHIAFIVDDVNSMVDTLRAKGFDTVGSVEDWQDTFRLCYIRGPEGLIVELAEQLGSDEPGWH